MFHVTLLKYITECTNMRLKILRDRRNKAEAKKKKKTRTSETILNADVHEIKMVFGVLMIMSYNHVPQISHH